MTPIFFYFYFGVRSRHEFLGFFSFRNYLLPALWRAVHHGVVPGFHGNADFLLTLAYSCLKRCLSRLLSSSRQSNVPAPLISENIIYLVEDATSLGLTFEIAIRLYIEKYIDEAWYHVYECLSEGENRTWWL